MITNVEFSDATASNYQIININPICNVQIYTKPITDKVQILSDEKLIVFFTLNGIHAVLDVMLRIISKNINIDKNNIFSSYFTTKGVLGDG